MGALYPVRLPSGATRPLTLAWRFRPRRKRHSKARCGAEPTMPFATHYGKYFQNSIREEALVSNSRAGIIYGQGGGGTLREVFQDVELNFYAKEPKDFTPMIFFSGDGFWQREAVIHNQQVVEAGIHIDTAVHNILNDAHYGIDKD